MLKIYPYKIQHFFILSVIFHLLFLFSWICLAELNKNQKPLEVFLITEFQQNSKQFTPGKLYRTTPINKTKKEKMNQQHLSENHKNIQDNITEKSNQSNSLSQNSGIFVTSNTTTLSSTSFLSKAETSSGSMIETEFGSIDGPKFIYKETPTYPHIARKLGKEGKVVLRLTLDEKGNLINIEVLQSAPYGFTEAAIEAIKKSKFAPAVHNGKPIPCKAILPVRFVLKD